MPLRKRVLQIFVFIDCTMFGRRHRTDCNIFGELYFMLHVTSAVKPLITISQNGNASKYIKQNGTEIKVLSLCFFSEIAIGIPDENARKAILDVMSADLNIAPSFDMKQLARCQTVFFVYDDPDK